MKVLAGWSKDAKAPASATQAISDFIYEAERGNQVNKLRAMANKAEDAASTILWKALLNVLSSPLTKDKQKKDVRNHVDKNPRDIGFFHAIADLGLTGFDKQLQEGMKGDNVIQIKAAQEALAAGKLAAASKLMVERPDIQARFDKDAVEPVGNTPDQFAAIVKGDVAKWKKVVKDANIKPD